MINDREKDKSMRLWVLAYLDAVTVNACFFLIIHQVPLQPIEAHQ